MENKIMEQNKKKNPKRNSWHSQQYLIQDAKRFSTGNSNTVTTRAGADQW